MIPAGMRWPRWIRALGALLFVAGCGAPQVNGPAMLAGGIAAGTELAQAYAAGCSDLMVAPALLVDWEGSTTRWGAGILAGCYSEGELAELLCSQDEAGGWSCSPIRIWRADPPPEARKLHPAPGGPRRPQDRFSVEPMARPPSTQFVWRPCDPGPRGGRHG